MAVTLSNGPTNLQTDHEAYRQKTDGCWTGWIADMEVMKNVMRKATPDTYLGEFPRHRATTLNTWLSRFGLYSNGMFFELDRYGTVLVKDLIKHSSSANGYWVRVDGKRNGDKIKVTSVSEVPRASYVAPDFEKVSQRQLRGEFARMGL